MDMDTALQATPLWQAHQPPESHTGGCSAPLFIQQASACFFLAKRVEKTFSLCTTRTPGYGGCAQPPLQQSRQPRMTPNLGRHGR